MHTAQPIEAAARCYRNEKGCAADQEVLAYLHDVDEQLLNVDGDPGALATLIDRHDELKGFRNYGLKRGTITWGKSPSSEQDGSVPQTESHEHLAALSLRVAQLAEQDPDVLSYRAKYLDGRTIAAVDI